MFRVLFNITCIIAFPLYLFEAVFSFKNKNFLYINDSILEKINIVFSFLSFSFLIFLISQNKLYSSSPKIIPIFSITHNY